MQTDMHSLEKKLVAEMKTRLIYFIRLSQLTMECCLGKIILSQHDVNVFSSLLLLLSSC